MKKRSLWKKRPKPLTSEERYERHVKKAKKNGTIRYNSQWK